MVKNLRFKIYCLLFNVWVLLFWTKGFFMDLGFRVMVRVRIKFMVSFFFRFYSSGFRI